MRPAIVLALALLVFPLPALAESLEGTILKFDKQNNRVLVKIDGGEKTVFLTKKTLGLEHAIEGAHVRIEFIQTDDGLSASEINPIKSGARG